MCEAYPMGGTPSQRRGWDAREDPRLLAFVTAFDFAVRKRARTWAVRFGAPGEADAAEVTAAHVKRAEDYLESATPEQREAIRKLTGA